jgi:hypothetical protein
MLRKVGSELKNAKTLIYKGKKNIDHLTELQVTERRGKSNDWMAVKNEVEWMWKEAVVVQLSVPA